MLNWRFHTPYSADLWFKQYFIHIIYMIYVENIRSACIIKTQILQSEKNIRPDRGSNP